jgi:CubicO group peptidase (beta-lactamase class C family)
MYSWYHIPVKKSGKAQILLLGTVSLSLIVCLCSPKPFIPSSMGKGDYEDAIRYCRKYLNDFMKKTKTVGMAVAVVDSDKVVYAEGFGYADKAAGKKVTDTTTFMIGSISKVLTATAVMQLVEQGTIALDSPIVNYLPEFTVKTRFKARPITVRDLLTHESGLPTDVFNGEFLGQRPFPGIDTFYRTVPTVFANEYVTNPPHTVQSYSNPGFSLLGNIVERMSKRTYREYMKDSIFSRLGMNHSAIGFNDERVKHSFSKCYDKDRETDPLYGRDIPVGGVVTNIADFSLFIKMLFSHGTLGDSRILADSTLAQMWSPQNADLPYEVSTMGLGYGVSNPAESLQAVGHDGGLPNFYSSFLALTKIKLGFIVFSNSSQGNPGGFLNKLVEPFYMSKMGRKLPELPSLPRMPEVQLSPHRLDEIAGYYQTTAGITHTDVKGKHCFVYLDGKPFTLIAHSDSTFSLQYKLLGLIPVHVPDLMIETHVVSGRTVVLLRSKGIVAIAGEKFIPETPHRAWLDRLGTYESVNNRAGVYTDTEDVLYKNFRKFDLTYEPKEKNFSFNGYQIYAISDTEALTRGWGRAAGETIRSYRENGKEFLWASGYALHRIPPTPK